MSNQKIAPTTEPQRRLSPWRVMLAIVLLAGLTAGSVFGFRWWQAEQLQAAFKPWFGAYVDVTATPTFAFEQVSGDFNHNAVLSFIVSPSDGSSDACTPTWGGTFTMAQAGASLDLDRRIARLKQQKGSIAISFGGLANQELAVNCADPVKLKAAYKAVIEQYDINTIDLDLEGSGLTDRTAATRRATAIAELQAERRSGSKPLAVWVTLPVTPQGLSEDGTNAVADLLSRGVDLAGVNAMVMDYGKSRGDQNMADASKAALTETKRQLGVLYQRAGIYLNDATLWSKIGATPMIGQNDVPDEVFTMDDAKILNDFARSRGLGRMSMWSANRDIPCGSNYVNLKIVSDSCSGVDQDKQGFGSALGAGFEGDLSLSAGLVTTQDADANAQTVDDPETSPYQIWSDSGAYLQGTKVVWRHNVYQAKWWTQGEVPDNPVLQAWQTPWELVGPVLPGEKPVPQATLPDGTYPEWSGESNYEAGQRILFKGVPYQAKWWNKGDSPAVATSNPTNSPWVPLTQAQINELQENKTNPN